MHKLSKEDIYDIFESHYRKLYQKRGTFLFRAPQHNETILTIVDGKLETYKTASKGDVVLMNFEIGSSAEKYIIDKESFAKRYVIQDDKYTIDSVVWTKCTANGKIEAFQYYGDTVKFTASWGADMLLVDGDYLCRPLGGDEYDIYRIESETFKKTYSEIK